MPTHSYLRLPHTSPRPVTAAQVAAAYHFPAAGGAGATVGVVELGGAFHADDLTAYCERLLVAVPSVECVAVAGAAQQPDPGGADVEVMLDVQVLAAVAPGAAQRVYFCPNTDAGFLAGVQQALDECDIVSISWGGPETEWSPNSMKAFDTVLAGTDKPVFVAAGDTGADDGTQHPTVDFPAASPHAIACGGTRLELDGAGERSSETVWDDNDRASATGGGVSQEFPGRDVPDVAGNADPATGYAIVTGGQATVVGGTSAVAPLMAGLAARVQQALGRPVTREQFMAAAAVGGACWDVTAGDNGAYRAGPGRDQTTGFGVPDGARLLEALTGTSPEPPISPPPISPPPGPPPAEPVTKTFTAVQAELLGGWAAQHHPRLRARLAAEAWRDAQEISS